MTFPLSHIAALATLSALTATGSLRAANPGALDSTFGTGGVAKFDFGNCIANSIALQDDGKIVVGGNAFIGSQDFALVRFNADGSTDTNFGSSGKATTDLKGGDDRITRVRVLSSGKILAAGTSEGDAGKDFTLVRYNSDGSLDTTFDPIGHDGKVSRDFGTAGDDSATDMIVQADGKILVFGRTSVSQNDTDFGVIRFNEDGSLDTTFGTGGVTTVDFTGTGKFDVGVSIALQADGKILLAGYSVISGYQFSLARLNTDGKLDTTFDGDGKVTTDVDAATFDYGEAVIALKSGKILVAGQSKGTFALARYNSNGSLDTTFGKGGIVSTAAGTASTIYSLAELSDGRILASGDLDSDFGLACYKSNGALDTTFGKGGIVSTDLSSGNTDQCRGLALLSDGRILLAGSANFVSFAVARYGAASVEAAAAPKLTLKGKKKRISTKSRAVIRGTASGSVTKVTYKLGKRTRAAKGTSSWKAVARLKPGRNIVIITAQGPGGRSKPVKVTVLRK